MRDTSETPVRRPLPPIFGGSDDDPTVPDPDTPASDTPAPQYVTREDFQASQTAMQSTLAMLNESIGAMRDVLARPVAAPAQTPAPADLITDDQYLDAIQERNVEVIRRYNDQREQRLINTHVKPLEAAGVEHISNLVKTTEIGGLKYYTRFKKEIDGYIANMAPALRMQAGVYKMAHDIVVGQHHDELSAEEHEAALRKSSTPDPMPSGGGRSGRVATAPTAGQVPRAADLGGRDAEEALSFRGISEDDQARKLGYADWADYMKKTEAYR